MKQYTFFDSDGDVISDLQEGCFGVVIDLIKLITAATALFILGLNLI